MNEPRQTTSVHEIGEYFVARNTTLVRIICNDMNNHPFQIVGLATLTTGPNKGKERIVRYMPCGKSSEGPFDLVKQITMAEYVKLQLNTR